tara:strand:+ start:3859 stop:4242 length:384 start_codon:yes stop_codon:yes gene_type:complete
MKKLIVDLDNTISVTENSDYKNSRPLYELLNKLNLYRDKGFQIVIHTSRNMRTYNNNIGKINIHTLPNIVAWLDKYDIPYDEIYIGKPWCGNEGFYIDDRAIRPSEFNSLSYEKIIEILENEKIKNK